MEWEEGEGEGGLLDLDEVLKVEWGEGCCYVMKGDIYLEEKRKGEGGEGYEKGLELGVCGGELGEKVKECK